MITGCGDFIIQVGKSFFFFSFFFFQVGVFWEDKFCHKRQIKEFPETSIPPYFSYNGQVKLGSLLCDQWIWREGGHNVEQETEFTAVYMYNKTYPVKRDRESGSANGIQYAPLLLHVEEHWGLFNKSSDIGNITATEFLPSVNETLFEVPSFCHF